MIQNKRQIKHQNIWVYNVIVSDVLSCIDEVNAFHRYLLQRHPYRYYLSTKFSHKTKVVDTHWPKVSQYDKILSNLKIRLGIHIYVN